MSRYNLGVIADCYAFYIHGVRGLITTPDPPKKLIGLFLRTPPLLFYLSPLLESGNGLKSSSVYTTNGMGKSEKLVVAQLAACCTTYCTLLALYLKQKERSKQMPVYD